MSLVRPLSWRDYGFVLGAAVLAVVTLSVVAYEWLTPKQEAVIMKPASSVFVDLVTQVSCNESGMIPDLGSTTTSSVSVSEFQEEEIRMLFVGDIMLDRNVKTRTQTAKDPSYPFRRLPKDWISSFDYAVGNLEGSVSPVRRPPEKTIDFQFDPSVVSVLKDQGFDALSQANNHALDQGTQGHADSVAALRREGILVFGHQVQDDQIAVATTTIKGKVFAFVGWNSTDNPIDETAAAKVLKDVRPQADYVIAYLHWGAEYQDRPLPSVVAFSRWLIDRGVDVVIGGHPHWVQGIYSYKKRPIVYSLGNFIFDQDWSAETRQGLAVGLTFRGRSVRLEPFPLQIDKSQPRVVTAEERTNRLMSLARISEPLLQTDVREGKVNFLFEDEE